MPYSPCELPKYPCERDMWDILAEEKRPIVVYGMGNGADKLIKRFEKYGIEISDFFASDGFVRGHLFHGKRVKSFSEIKEEHPDFVIVLSFATSRPEVLETLGQMNAAYEMYVPDMPVAGEEYFDREFFNSHYSQIVSARDALADDDSKNAFCSIINCKLTGKMSYILEAFSEKQELYELIGSRRDIRTYVDAGAYNGDTLREAVDALPSLERAYLIEPDPKNYKKLVKYTEALDGLDITAVNAAAWSECATGSFSVSGNRNSSVGATRSYEHRESEVPLVTVDSLAAERVDYIKYDVEGAEREALAGTAETILRDTPVLLVSLYHRSEDIFAITSYLHERYGERYDLFIRRLRCLPAWEIDLILIPKA